MNKKLLLSLGAIAVLVLYIVFSGWQKSPDVPDLAWKDALTDIRITAPGNSLHLYQKDGSWVVGDQAYPVDKSTVDSISKKLTELEIDDVISQKGFLEKYDLTPEKCIRVEALKDGAVFRTVCFGKKSSTGRHTYITVDNAKDVYLASGVFDRLLNKTVDQLRDKNIMKIGRDAVMSFQVKYGSHLYVFDKSKREKKEPVTEKDEKEIKEPKKVMEDVWTCKGFEKVELDKNKVNRLLSGLDPLRAAGFSEIDRKALGPVQAVVKVKAFDKDMEVSIYYKKDEKNYLAVSSESPYVFTLEEWKAKKFFLKGLDTLKK